MLEKIKIYLKTFISRLSDLRYLGQVVFVVIVLLVSWSGIKAIQTNYELQKHIVELEQRNEVQYLKNENLKLENKYLETNEFLELAARRQFGKATPGEKVVIVPREVALRHVSDISIETPERAQERAEKQKPFYQRNLEAWGDFFFSR